MKTSLITVHKPLLATLINSKSLLQKITVALATTMVIWASAKIQIPFYPVPLTLQTFLIVIIGMAYGWKWGSLTVLFYLAEGAVGLPVFAGTPEKGLGLVYMLGSTGGYLLGFVLSTLIVGKLAERGWDKNALTTSLAMAIGHMVIYASGLLWLGTTLGWDKPILSWGLYPFLLGDALKVLLASILMPSIWKIVKLAHDKKK